MIEFICEITIVVEVKLVLGLDFDCLPHFIYANKRQFLPGEHHITRVFNESVLLIIRKGILRFREDGKDIELAKGEYYLQQAGLSQTGPIESDIPNYFFIHFQGKFIENGRLPMRGMYNHKTIEPLIEAFQTLGNNAPVLEYERLFYNILSELCKQQHDETIAEQIKVFLHENYRDTTISTETLANEFLLSRNRVRTIFQSAYNKSPRKYLLEYRLDKARDLLVSSTRTINDIANYVGFEDYSVFYREFSAHYKVSPSTYREIGAPSYFAPPPNERP